MKISLIDASFFYSTGWDDFYAMYNPIIAIETIKNLIQWWANAFRCTAQNFFFSLNLFVFHCCFFQSSPLYSIVCTQKLHSFQYIYFSSFAFFFIRQMKLVVWVISFVIRKKYFTVMLTKHKRFVWYITFIHIDYTYTLNFSLNLLRFYSLITYFFPHPVIFTSNSLCFSFF